MAKCWSLGNPVAKNNTLKEGNRMMMVRGGNAISDLTTKESFKILHTFVYSCDRHHLSFCWLFVVLGTIQWQGIPQQFNGGSGDDPRRDLSEWGGLWVLHRKCLEKRTKGYICMVRLICCKWQTQKLNAFESLI